MFSSLAFLWGGVSERVFGGRREGEEGQANFKWPKLKLGALRHMGTVTLSLGGGNCAVGIGMF